MAFPYEIRNHAGEKTVFHKKIAEGASAVGALHTTPANYTVNLPSNVYSLAAVLEVTGTNVGLRAQVRPWLNEEQTILGDPVALAKIGSGTNGTTFMTIAATSSGAISGQTASTFAAIDLCATLPYGVQMRVYSASTVGTGTYDLTVLAVPRK